MCSDCGGTGWLVISRYGAEGVVRCECVKTNRPDRLLEGARIPLRYAHCELANFDPLPSANRSIEKAKIAAEKFVDEYPMSQPLLFMGPQGVGKTHLAVGIIKELMRPQSRAVPFSHFSRAAEGNPKLL